MKKSVILFSLLSVWFFSQAQTPVVVTYSYDANGNQTSRSIQFSKMGENNDSHAFEEEYLTAIHDTVGLIPFSIYPNPTCDQICVERRDQEGMGVMTLYLSTVSGVLIRKVTMDGNPAFLDLTDLSPGLYTLLMVGIAGERRSWKVIKR